ncbi:uncharacterized protein EDB93DRAFT_1073118, partial [Suillus bovinus]|uniref:uncharacterized protein n=1 Tax=Suillus bovinus TaxID=48563 RepID=UPI001B85CC90
LPEAVWNTLELYGLKNRIMAVVCDNASNNDTLLQTLEEKCADEGIDFSAKHSRTRCLPHIVHLAAMQLLEGIGAIKPDAKQNKRVAILYQESVTAPLGHEHDDYAALLDEAEDDT